MKYWIAILGAAALTACATTPPTEADEASENKDDVSGYDEDVWFLSDGWPGEYPDSFTVEVAGITVMARAEMKPDAPRNVSCPLPQYATYSPWNGARVQADNLAFVTASPRITVTFPSGASLLGVTGNAFESKETDLRIPAGGQLTYVAYIAEGWAIMEYQGTQYEVNEGALPQDAIFCPENVQDDQWARVTCTDGTRAWLLYSKVKDAAGIGVYTYTEYGTASDLEP